MTQDEWGFVMFMMMMVVLLPTCLAFCIDTFLPVETWLQQRKLNRALRRLGGPWYERRAEICGPWSFVLLASELVSPEWPPAGGHPGP